MSAVTIINYSRDSYSRDSYFLHYDLYKCIIKHSVMTDKMLAIVKVLLILQLSIALCTSRRSGESRKSSRREEECSFLSRTQSHHCKCPRPRQSRPTGTIITVREHDSAVS